MELYSKSSLRGRGPGVALQVQADEGVLAPKNSGTKEDMRVLSSGTDKAVIDIQGMVCAACSGAVESKLLALGGVEKVQVSLLGAAAEVSYQSKIISSQSLLEAIEDTGFDCQLRSNEKYKDPDCDTTRIRVTGMTCTACSTALEQAIDRHPSVRSVSVSLATEEAVIEHYRSISPAELATLVEDTGFDATLLCKSDTVVLSIEGMSCSACSSAVESALKSMNGVTSAQVNLLASEAHVSYDQGEVGVRDLVEAVEDAGFIASLKSTDTPLLDRSDERNKFRKAFLLACLFTIPALVIADLLPVLAWSRHLEYRTRLGPFDIDNILTFLLVTPVQFWLGWPFYKGAWKAYKNGVANMDVLVVLGTSSAYFCSVFSVLYAALHPRGGTSTHFMTASAVLITFILLGKYLEVIAKSETTAAITKLLHLAPEEAILVIEDKTGNTEEKRIMLVYI